MKKVLEVQNLTKIYKLYRSNFDRLKEIFSSKEYHRNFVANDNISFDLYEKETLGIIGVNGAGKSTLLKMIAGVIVPSGGSIKKLGRVTALLELGTGFNNEQSGYENIFLNGSLLGMSRERIEQSIEDIISFSELGSYIGEPIKTYSSGMKMRLAFSIAIYSQPQILIVDEALSVGDAHFSAKCTQALKERKQNNMSIIYVSHDLNSLKVLCDRVMLLNAGRVEQVGSPEDVIHSYNYIISKLNESNGSIVQRQEQKSFGSFDVEIMSVDVVGSSGGDVIFSGEDVAICVKITSYIDAEDMTVGILIQDKFSQHIFGTNTYNLKKSQNFLKDRSYEVTFRMKLNIGVGVYFVTAAIHKEKTHLHSCSHWVDRAAEFKVVANSTDEFIGLARLEPTVEVKELI